MKTLANREVSRFCTNYFLSSDVTPRGFGLLTCLTVFVALMLLRRHQRLKHSGGFVPSTCWTTLLYPETQPSLQPVLMRTLVLVGLGGPLTQSCGQPPPVSVCVCRGKV